MKVGTARPNEIGSQRLGTGSGARQHVAGGNGQDALRGFAQPARFAVGVEGNHGVVAARAERAGQQHRAAGKYRGYQALHVEHSCGRQAQSMPGIVRRPGAAANEIPFI